jgi:hypothetical protein
MVGGVVVKKILAAIDRSEYKKKIIAYAFSMGKAWGAEVTAIHVIDPGRGKSHFYNFRRSYRSPGKGL